MATKSGGAILVDALISEGIDTIFGIPGTHSLAIYDALIDASNIKQILTRHEQGAAFMADGYARSSGKIGVCLTTTGVAALNTFTALATAYGDSSPVLLICTQIPKKYIDKDRGLFHEVKGQLEMLKNITCYSARADSIEEVGFFVHKSIEHSLSNRFKPVAIEIPVDVLDAEADCKDAYKCSLSKYEASEESLINAAKMIKGSRRPLIFAGGGIDKSSANNELIKFVDSIQAPVLTSIPGKCAIPSDHPFYLGYIQGQDCIQEFIKSCDLLIAIGVRFSYLATERWTVPFPEKIIHIDIDRNVIGKNYNVTLGVVSDAKSALARLTSLVKSLGVETESRKDEIKELRAKVQKIWENCNRTEYQIIEDIRTALPRETIFVGDPTICCYASWQLLDVYNPRSYLYPMAGATLGFGFPAALGAKVAQPDKTVVSIIGDGGFQFACQELGTAVQYGINTITLLFNDNGYGVLRVQQDERFKRRIACDLLNPDFCGLAESFGAHSARVDDLGLLKQTIESVLEIKKPVLIEIPAHLSTQKITT
jgi:acetolactate synthase-1/2/3 large subunit